LLPPSTIFYPLSLHDALPISLFVDLAGFPPILIQVGSAETLLADATRLAEAAGAADVDVTLQIWPHMIHAWPVWNASLQDGRHSDRKSTRLNSSHDQISYAVF